MITSKEFDVDGYRDGVSRSGFDDRVLDIDSALAVADSNDCWRPEFLEYATVRAKKSFLRRLHRHGFVDSDGNRVEWLNVEELDEETGEVRKGYKQLEFFSLDNFEYAIRDCKRRIQTEERKYRAIVRLAGERFGEGPVQDRFEFMLPFRKRKPVHA